jgi:hypothetical protein
MSLAMIAGELDEGPMVAMIFVRLIFDMTAIIAYSRKKFEQNIRRSTAVIRYHSLTSAAGNTIMPHENPVELP